jgi:hypothetical protein
MRIVGFPSEFQLWKGRRGIPILYGLIRGIAAPLFFCRIALSILGEAVDGCQRSLTTMYFVMLPRNPPPESFKQLLVAFRSSQRIHRLIELNLVVGANFALGWIRKWHPRLNYSSMSLSLPPGHMKVQVHMDATLQPPRRIIGRLLQEDARFFREHHYLKPLMVDDSDQPML